jgi:hypothetical protein
MELPQFVIAVWSEIHYINPPSPILIEAIAGMSERHQYKLDLRPIFPIHTLPPIPLSLSPTHFPLTTITAALSKSKTHLYRPKGTSTAWHAFNTLTLIHPLSAGDCCAVLVCYGGTTSPYLCPATHNVTNHLYGRPSRRPLLAHARLVPFLS